MSWGRDEDKKVDWYEAARAFDKLNEMFRG